MKIEQKYKKILKWNKFMGLLHLVQAIVMLALALNLQKAIDFKPMITSSYLKFDETQMRLITDTTDLFTIPFAAVASIFLFISAFFHFYIVFKKEKYIDGLEKNINTYRWYEYALSSSLMISLIAILFGVYDLSTLILIFMINASMNLFGLLMERINQLTSKTDWSPFIFGSIAGITPWIIIIMYAFGNTAPAEVPGFVYAILVSYFIFFNAFPINMILQYKKIGKWIDYLYGEKVYIILSLLAKTVLIWLIFFGIMQPA